MAMVSAVADQYHVRRKELFHFAMKGEWNEVKNVYKSDQAVHDLTITRSGRTALHVAVSDGQDDIVEDLINIIRRERNKAAKKINAAIDAAAKTRADPETEISKINKTLETEIEASPKPLEMKDDRENTPLHTAAELGNARMCYCIAGEYPLLVGARNRDGETPLFLAALHGHMDAFLCLHYICGQEKGSKYCRRADGETILHCSISGDYFDLAFQIIHLYPNLVNNFNERGESPLHLLAAKPSAFRSGSHLGRVKRIMYHCILVDELEEVPKKEFSRFKSKEIEKKKMPENYEACWNVYKILKGMVRDITGRGNTKQTGDTGKKHVDVESPPPSGSTEDKHSAGDPVSSQNQSNSTSKEPTSNKGCLNFILSSLGEEDDQSRNGADQRRQLFPGNNRTIFELVKLVSKGMLIILGLGSNEIKKMRDKKEKHTWSLQILNQLLERVSTYEYEDDGAKPLVPHPEAGGDDLETQPYGLDEVGGVTFVPDAENIQQSKSQKDSVAPHNEKNLAATAQESTKQEKEEGDKTTILLAIKNSGSTNIIQKIQEQFPVAIHDTNTRKKLLLAVENLQTKEMIKKESPILIAAKNGITEIVEKILHLYPVAIHDINSDKKNAVLLAVENRQPHVYELLLKITIMKDSVFRRVDSRGNSALHLAATQGENKPWLIPGAALQMQWELKWYEFVKDSMPFHFFVRHNNENKTPKDILTETHHDLVKAGGEWLTNTSESCSVVAALIATVAFATSATVPGGVKQDIGTPTLEDEPAFNVFAISSLVALCFSVTALVMFLAILTSRYQERDFAYDLPRKLLIGLTSLFVSIASMLISFCAGHFFVLKDKLKYAAFPIYAVTCLPVTFFATAQFPLYFDLIWATFKKLPQRSYKSVQSS